MQFNVSVYCHHNQKRAMDDFSPYRNVSNEGIRPVAIISQLLQSVATMHHIDELLTWIANIMVQRLNARSVQIWAVQADTTGAAHSKLRTRTDQYLSPIQQITESAEVRVHIERLLREKRGFLSLPVATLFSQQQANALLQHNCRFWTVYFINKNVLLPPTQREAKKEEISTPLQMICSFFTQQPFQAEQTRAIQFLMEQALRIAISHNLLQQPSSNPARKSEQTAQLPFAYLVPEHTQGHEIEQTENPFNSAVIIPDKRVRQIYNLIDGKKNVADLALLAHASQKRVLEALQSLYSQGLIKLNNTAGNPAETSSFFPAS
jgi:hypothetical protein